MCVSRPWIVLADECFTSVLVLIPKYRHSLSIPSREDRFIPAPETINSFGHFDSTASAVVVVSHLFWHIRPRHSQGVPLQREELAGVVWSHDDRLKNAVKKCRIIEHYLRHVSDASKSVKPEAPPASILP